MKKTNKINKIAIIGCGNMGAAILEGIYKNSKVMVCESDPKKNQLLKRKYNVTFCDVSTAIDDSQIIVLAVKPQIFPELLEEIKVFNIKDKLFVSIAAGITTSFIEKKLGKDVRVIRTMPNLPAQVKQGITAICGGKNLKKKDISLVADIFKEIGKTVIVEEKMIDAVTAVSGSGPAYVFLFVECFVKAAQSLGFDAATSKELVLQTLKGSLCLLDNCNEDAGVLRSRVTSKGGTTQAALEVFAKGKFEKTFKTALLSARKRAKELSRR
ncbi:MAG: pyrroline-5-carboxylate reductase [Omnitrophica WOR_2 bacterium GWF2_38_59]|nr:MAG: pyrroline-5-carboxylate reductase [Omnitrophica WOR_2 bacterium GWF2_38_59]OGX47961.1 MAG: pyrroline-5-carboxylate reductase [Omnitrophica WOR_2 bacterium RIFOXYA2_FULL_38_17]OGX51793.1 MAG: pyrroline-5-carboxylate reductase [Omnitrophica WOR_2 bacterium RIFOXYA12_FULL_38_10]OGX56298.1 MAG: pyrroline-5-carboxylate reductase [Omnitrophica WOR_2 bacterium RIFOXYC2_FULL_38_12]OGX60197.1 MAG: pyrroline-5-carboxylate reductase [Omnitrophica WOR_2 bacterium RIFOXYB2_FULL_38_16]HBG61076.1 pyr